MRLTRFSILGIGCRAFRGNRLRGKMSNMLRKLRIAWSVGCWFACMSLLLLWLRSLFLVDIAVAPISANSSVAVGTMPGTLMVAVSDSTGYQPWKLHTKSVVDTFYRGVTPRNGFSSRMWGSFAVSGWQAELPYWLLILLGTILGVAPWLCWQKQFSLRTLLIGTTLIAAVLGIIAAANK
jgi:hypothetical protein